MLHPHCNREFYRYTRLRLKYQSNILTTIKVRIKGSWPDKRVQLLEKQLFKKKNLFFFILGTSFWKIPQKKLPKIEF